MSELAFCPHPKKEHKPNGELACQALKTHLATEFYGAEDILGCRPLVFPMRHHRTQEGAWTCSRSKPHQGMSGLGLEPGPLKLLHHCGFPTNDHH